MLRLLRGSFLRYSNSSPTHLTFQYLGDLRLHLSYRWYRDNGICYRLHISNIYCRACKISTSFCYLDRNFELVLTRDGTRIEIVLQPMYQCLMCITISTFTDELRLFAFQKLRETLDDLSVLLGIYWRVPKSKKIIKAKTHCI